MKWRALLLLLLLLEVFAAIGLEVKTPSFPPSLPTQDLSTACTCSTSLHRKRRACLLACLLKKREEVNGPHSPHSTIQPFGYSTLIQPIQLVALHPRKPPLAKPKRRGKTDLGHLSLLCPELINPLQWLKTRKTSSSEFIWPLIEVKWSEHGSVSVVRGPGLVVGGRPERWAPESGRVRGLRAATPDPADPQGLHRAAVRGQARQPGRLPQGVLPEAREGESLHLQLPF